jgi:hypothetical protein
MKLYEYFENILSDEKIKEKFEKLKGKKIQFIRPDLKIELEEIKRTIKDLKLSNKLKEIKEQFENNELAECKYKEIDNSDYSSVSTFDDVLELVKKYDKNIDRLLEQFDKGKIEASIILLRDKHKPYLIGGNTRLMLLKVLEIEPQVLEITIKD